MAGNGRDGDGNPIASAMGRFSRLAAHLRPHRLAPEPPQQAAPDPRAVLANALQPWVQRPEFPTHFLPELDSRIKFANGAVVASILEGRGDAATHFAVGYESALRDLRAAFIAWGNGQPAIGPSTTK